MSKSPMMFSTRMNANSVLPRKMTLAESPHDQSKSLYVYGGLTTRNKTTKAINSAGESMMSFGDKVNE